MFHRFVFIGVLIGGFLSVAAVAQTARNATPQDGFRYLSAKDAIALVNKPGPGPILSLLSDHEDYFSEVVSRKTDGQVELHQHWIDFVTVLSGDATLTYGGTLAGAKETAPGEMRGGTISGGKTIALHRGDYLEIPSGVPHLMTAPQHDFTYLVVKVRV